MQVVHEARLHYLLSYELVDDYMERRAPLREEHLAMLGAFQRRGELLMAGALADPPDRAVLVFTVEGAAERFAKEDPYVKAGLVKAWTVRKWNVVIGGEH